MQLHNYKLTDSSITYLYVKFKNIIQPPDGNEDKRKSFMKMSPKRSHSFVREKNPINKVKAQFIPQEILSATCYTDGL